MPNFPEFVKNAAKIAHRNICYLMDNWDILTEEQIRKKRQEIREFDLPGSQTDPSDIPGFTVLDENTGWQAEIQELDEEMEDLTDQIQELKAMVLDLKKSQDNDHAQCVAADLVYMFQQKNNANDFHSLSALFPKNDEANFRAAALAMKHWPCSEFSHPGQREYKHESWEHVIDVISKDFPFSSPEEKKLIIEFIHWIRTTIKDSKPFENWDWID